MIFLAASLTDALDGWIAKRFGQQTQLGEILDPLADKSLAIGLYITLAWQGWVPFWLVLAVVSRDSIILVGAMAYHYLTGLLEITPSLLSKFNTALQLGFIALVLLDAATALEFKRVQTYLAFVVLVTTVGSGLHYVFVWLRKVAYFEYQNR